MKRLISMFVLAAAACNQPAGPAAKPAPAAESAPASAGAGQAALCPPWKGRFDPKGPLWLQVARTREGAFVQFSPRGVRRDPMTCETEAEVRILHREPQQWTSADGQVDVLYSKESLVYRFRCASSSFLLTQRRFLGPDDEIAHTESYAQDETAWRPISNGGPAAILWGPICQPPRR
jgi:hypothetical protein